MALTILVTPAAGDIIQSSVWINEFNNIYNNPISLISPLTGTLNLNGQTLSGAATFSGAITFSAAPVFSGTITGTYTLGGTPTLGAATLGGTVSGGGNQINNVIIGTTTPLAGSFTAVSATTVTPSTATPGTPVSGVLYSDSIPRVWAYVTLSGGTPTVTKSINVTSIIDNGTGDWTLNFTTALASANYAALITAGSVTAGVVAFGSPRNLATGSLRWLVHDDTGSAQDNDSYIVIFGG